MKVKKFKPLGAELTNFVFNNKTTEEELTKLKKIFLQNSVLILRGLDLNAKNEILNSVKLINRFIDEIESKCPLKDY